MRRARCGWTRMTTRTLGWLLGQGFNNSLIECRSIERGDRRQRSSGRKFRYKKQYDTASREMIVQLSSFKIRERGSDCL
jgi:hypothetical protein